MYELISPRNLEYTFYLAARDKSGNYSNYISKTMYHPGIQKLAQPTVQEYFQAFEIYLPVTYDLYDPETGIAKGTPEPRPVMGYTLRLQQVGGAAELREYRIPQEDFTGAWVEEVPTGTEWNVTVGAYDSAVHPDWNATEYEATFSDPVNAEPTLVSDSDLALAYAAQENYQLLREHQFYDYDGMETVTETNNNVLVNGVSDYFELETGAWDVTPVADDIIVVAGFANAANNGVFTVASATSTRITVSESLTTESAGESVSIDKRGYFDGTHIKPNTVETQALVVGSGTRNFQMFGVEFEPNEGFSGTLNRITNTAGTLALITDPDEDAVAWTISAGDETVTYNSDAHWVYARCPKSMAAGTIMYSTTRPAAEDATYHYFIIGQYVTTNSTDTPARLGTSYGFTYIDGNMLTTGTLNCSVVNVSGGGGTVRITGTGLEGGPVGEDPNFIIDTSGDAKFHELSAVDGNIVLKEADHGGVLEMFHGATSKKILHLGNRRDIGEATNDGGTFALLNADEEGRAGITIDDTNDNGWMVLINGNSTGQAVNSNNGLFLRAGYGAYEGDRIDIRNNATNAINIELRGESSIFPNGRIWGKGELRIDGKSDLRGDIYMTNLPTSDPGSAGQLWNSGGTVKASTG